MEPILYLPAACTALPMRLESKSATAHQEASGAVAKRNCGQSARPLGEAARSGESLKMAASPKRAVAQIILG